MQSVKDDPVLMLANEMKSSNPQSKSMSKTGIILLTLSGGAAVTLSAICLPFVTPALRRICLPYVPATEQQLCNVVDALKASAGLSSKATAWRQKPGGRLLVDLGSGDGRVVESTCKEGIASIGVELNPWLVVYSKVRALLLGISPRPTYKRCNLWKFPLQDYSDVVIFGVQSMMPELEAKFGQELLQGSRIVACRFPLPTWQPIATFGSGVDTVWLYQVKETIQNSESSDAID